MDDARQVAWIRQRVSFGSSPAELAGPAPTPAELVESWTDPFPSGRPLSPDPWADLELTSVDPQRPGEISARLIGNWLQAMASGPDPFGEWVRWFWHGHFVSTLRVVKSPLAMVNQLRLFARYGLGDFATLLRAVTIDPAMLCYLDGRTSTKAAVNENYGREVLELFSLGIDQYSEADVRAGATALTGWKVSGLLTNPTARLNPRHHDDHPQTYLGRAGVHDLDGVIDAIVSHPACAGFVTTKLTSAILGPGVDPGVTDRLAADFAAGGLQVLPLIRAIVRAGLDGHGQHLVQAPVPWLASACRATGADITAVVGNRGDLLAATGQVPLDAPNVAGWPGGSAWLGASSTVARMNLALAVARRTPEESPPLEAARRRHWDELARWIGSPAEFGAATVAGLEEAASRSPDGRVSLAVALASPDTIVLAEAR